MNLDSLDIAILNLLQSEGRLSNAELARRIDLSPPATFARLRRLEAEGFIRSYAALLDLEKSGFDMLCFVQISLQLHQPEQVQAVRQAIQALPEVLECYHVTGEYDFLLKVAIRNRADLERFALQRLTPIQGVRRIQTNVVLSEVKSTTVLPLAVPSKP
ncbi:MAG: AsnC family transcriptional regulator [Chloroflexi bacterium RBG_16_54_18]|nr:MAG: AsnC family transcriptional regulator [Chloroflexi bacterium RBG_16_54_18]